MVVACVIASLLAVLQRSTLEHTQHRSRRTSNVVYVLFPASVCGVTPLMSDFPNDMKCELIE